MNKFYKDLHQPPPAVAKLPSSMNTTPTSKIIIGKKKSLHQNSTVRKLHHEISANVINSSHSNKGNISSKVGNNTIAFEPEATC